jgi:hypothetical protein
MSARATITVAGTAAMQAPALERRQAVEREPEAVSASAR